MQLSDLRGFSSREIRFTHYNPRKQKVCEASFVVQPRMHPLGFLSPPAKKQELLGGHPPFHNIFLLNKLHGRDK